MTPERLDASLRRTGTSRVAADPERFVVPDPDVGPTLLDQVHAGRRMMLITNSDWAYTQRMMAHAIDPYLPSGIDWRDIFDAVIVSSVKPDFFVEQRPLYRVVDEGEGLLAPHVGPLDRGSAYFGGCAGQVEESLGLAGDQILYVGDHLFGDVHVSKRELKWRTALILREMESEVAAQRRFAPRQAKLLELMTEKRHLEQRLASLRLSEQRGRLGYAEVAEAYDASVEARIRAELTELDDELAPLAEAAGKLRNERWGPLMRAGLDKSLFARQVERYADVYTSRVSNFLAVGPHAMLRTARLPLPHD